MSMFEMRWKTPCVTRMAQNVSPTPRRAPKRGEGEKGKRK